MRCAKMQGAMKAARVVDPSTSHFTSAPQVNASASPAQILLISGESSFKEIRQEDRRKNSSWIRRLTPRDASELSKGGSGEASFETSFPEKGNLGDRMDAGPGAVQPGWFPQERASNKARPNGQAEIFPDAKRQKTSELKDFDGIEKQRSSILQEKTAIETGKSMTSSAMAPPSSVGFGPWVNFNTGRKPDAKPELALGSKVIANTTTTSTQELSKDIHGGFRSAFSSTTSISRCSPVSIVGDGTAPAVFCKSPLSSAHGKIGLPPRPPCQKSSGFQPPSKVAPSSNGIGRGGFRQLAQDVQANRQVFETPSSRESIQSGSVQHEDTTKFAEAAIGRCESFFQKSNPSEQSYSDCIRDHGKGLSDCGKPLFARGKSNLPTRQAMPSVADRASAYIAIGQPLGSGCNGAAVQFENGRTVVCEDLHSNMYGEGMKAATLPSAGTDLHLKVSVPGMENPLAGLKNVTAIPEPNKTAVQQSPSGSSYGTSTCEKADASASTSASLPWEMFIESAGTSRKAREQFVEVYNRARDELKNQRMSHKMSRALSKEGDGRTKLTLGPGDTASDHRLKRQLSNHEQHSAGHSRTQGRLNVPSTNSECRASSLALIPKEQHSISLVESKGPVTTLANEQSGLQRDNGVFSKSDTLWKQADDFRLERSLPERQLALLSTKTAGQEGVWQIACQRLDNIPVIHTTEVRPADKDQIFSSSVAGNTQELASKLCESNALGQTARLSQQLDDKKESISALGKRSHVTFEEHSISRGTAKGAVSQANPQGRPHVWLQRWHPTSAYNSKGLPDAQGQSDGKRSESASYLTLGLKKFKDGDGVGVFGRSRELQNVSGDKQKGVKSLKTSSSKILPSAAAMAIVGTAARQFCSAQPQRKGSFAFWSGYGMPPPRKVEPVQEDGKAKTFLKVDVNTPNC